MREGCKIYFSRSKKCTYALKVLCGKSFEFKGKRIDSECFSKYSDLIANIMSNKLTNEKRKFKNNIIISKEDIEKYSNNEFVK